MPEQIRRQQAVGSKQKKKRWSDSFWILAADFRLLFLFLPLLISYLRIRDQKLKRFAIAQPASDATFASLLCQDTTHLFRRLSRGLSDRINLVFDFRFRDFDLLFVG